MWLRVYKHQVLGHKSSWDLRMPVRSAEQAMATHSSTLAWKIPWTKEPDRLQSMGSLRISTTERLHFHFSLSCMGEGNGNPLQCSCLENPRDGGAWWAAVYEVEQSRTRLKRLSSKICMMTPHQVGERTEWRENWMKCPLGGQWNREQRGAGAWPWWWRFGVGRRARWSWTLFLAEKETDKVCPFCLEASPECEKPLLSSDRAGNRNVHVQDVT